MSCIGQLEPGTKPLPRLCLRKDRERDTVLTALRKNCQKLESERNNSNEEQILTAKTKCSGIQ